MNLRYSYADCMNGRYLGRWYNSTRMMKEWTIEAVRVLKATPRPRLP